MWLIRHAESIWNAEGRWQGQADPPLSDHGRRQAERLALRLADEGIALLVASDLHRAAETAAAVGRQLGIEVRPDLRLREIEAGHWSGLTHAEIEARDGAALAHFFSGDVDARAGGGESRREAAARASQALGELAREAAGRGIAVVTHGGIVQSLLPGVRLANTAWTRVDASREFGA
ncbi:MAG: histidine phosphatase family protein [Deltaproteobacteria bacterium]|nr:histidine phosphatase family protein [Deltaproteobacteria bacterium]MBW2360657.1 histidine phosphatase family protein [Deltaproteobacteria bacterium]